MSGSSEGSSKSGEKKGLLSFGKSLLKFRKKQDKTAPTEKKAAEAPKDEKRAKAMSADEREEVLGKLGNVENQLHEKGETHKAQRLHALVERARADDSDAGLAALKAIYEQISRAMAEGDGERPVLRGVLQKVKATPLREEAFVETLTALECPGEQQNSREAGQIEPGASPTPTGSLRPESRNEETGSAVRRSDSSLTAGDPGIQELVVAQPAEAPVIVVGEQARDGIVLGAAGSEDLPESPPQSREKESIFKTPSAESEELDGSSAQLDQIRVTAAVMQADYDDETMVLVKTPLD